MSIITLTSDFGSKDHYVGAMKGKLLSEFAEVQLVDISHHIDPFNVAEAGYILLSSYFCFPKGTVHIICVDAEWNEENKHIAVLWNGHYFVTADNGILSIVMQKIKPEQMVAINIHNRLPLEATATDVFIKVACHLARGGHLNVIGKEISEITTLSSLVPVVSKDGSRITCSIIYIDNYGNLVTNLTKESFVAIGKERPYEIKIKSKPIKTIYPNYGSIGISAKYPAKYYEGNAIAIFNEMGYLEIGIYRANPYTSGSATSLLGLGYRDAIFIEFL